MSESTGSGQPPTPTPTLAMRLLVAGVPLSLLVDLTAREGPDSRQISARERPDDLAIAWPEAGRNGD